MQLAGVLCFSHHLICIDCPAYYHFLSDQSFLRHLGKLKSNETNLVLIISPHLKCTEVTDKLYMVASDFALIQKDFNEKGQPFLFLGHSGDFFVSLNCQYLLISQLLFFSLLISNLTQLEWREENTIGGLMAQYRNVCLLDNRKGNLGDILTLPVYIQ